MLWLANRLGSCLGGWDLQTEATYRKQVPVNSTCYVIDRDHIKGIPVAELLVGKLQQCVYVSEMESK